jgi:ribosomal protein S18 acetylase RimI-like enzyme
MDIIQATVDDAEDILMIQKLAYQSEAELYGNYDIPPLKQTVEDLRDQFKDHVILKAVLDKRIIGTVRAYEEDGTCYIGRLAVHPAFQNQGAGAALMKTVEGCFSPQRFELFTGSKSVKNIHLYEKLGYTIFRSGSHGCGDIEIFFMEKSINKYMLRGDYDD